MKHLGFALTLATAASLGGMHARAVAGGGDPIGPPAIAQSDVAPSSELPGPPFESEAAGLSLRIPKGCQRVRASNAGDDIAQFADPKRKWELKLSRTLRQTAASLMTTRDNFGKPIPGL